MYSDRVRTYCAMSKSRCGVVCHVEAGRLVKVEADADHPNGGICVKGAASPQLVYDPDRLQYPMRRTRPKGDPDPGWERLSWEEALDEVARRLLEIRERHGAEAVFFYRPSPGGSAANDFEPWMVRLASAFGSPNTTTTGHICNWHKDSGSRYTYGVGIPAPDFEQTACILLWGHNPHATWPTQAMRIQQALRRGAKLIVIDPRRIPLARRADLWLPVRPGTDGAMALSFLQVMLSEQLYDVPFLREWTNAPLLIRADTGGPLTMQEVDPSSPPQRLTAWDLASERVVSYDPATQVYGAPLSHLALQGQCSVPLPGGERVKCKTAFQCLLEAVSPYPPEVAARITGVPADQIRQAVRLFCHGGRRWPSCYYSYNGLEQHSNAMQTNRAVCLFFALSGNFDRPGGNVIFPRVPTNSVLGRELLSAEQVRKRLGLAERPLGPAGANGSIQAYEAYRAILSGEPYPVKALVSFGGDLIISNGDTLQGRAALQRLEFYVQTDLFETPAARLADILLPAATCWESASLITSFEQGRSTSTYLQYRPRIVAPLYECRPDIDVVFDLAVRMGLGEHFWNGDVESGYHYLLQPSGLTLEQLKASPGGLFVERPLPYEKYKGGGFHTPSRKVELYSLTFQRHGYPPLPTFAESFWAEAEGAGVRRADYPLVLTTAKVIQFCHGQHRSLPHNRRQVPQPFLEIHPADAVALGISDGDQVWVEAGERRITLQARLTNGIRPGVVATQHGWWQACPRLGLPGYNPFGADGANLNLLISNHVIDPISGSVPHRSYPCRVGKA